MNDIIAGDPAPTNPTAPVEPSERDQLMFMMLHGGATSDAIATWRVNRFASEVREQARAKVLADGLERAADVLTNTNPDRSADFSDGVEWAVDALLALAAEAGESRG